MEELRAYDKGLNDGLRDDYDPWQYSTPQLRECYGMGHETATQIQRSFKEV
jgi:hypothetical protein